LLAVCCAATTALAQYRFDHWTAETGLPQNIITALHQTPEGYLWIATLDGLTRFDGLRFTVFNKSNTPGIRSNRFNCLYEDTQGDLWAGTEVGAITRYQQGQFVTYAAEHGLPAQSVFALTGDGQGHVLALSGNQVREWDPVTQRFKERPLPLFTSGPGRLNWNLPAGFWGANQAGLHLFLHGTWSLLPLPAEVKAPITEVAQADDGGLWLLTAEGRIFQHQQGKASSFVPAPDTRRLTEWRDRTGKNWEIEIGEGLLRKLTIASSGQPVALPPLRVIYEDRDGNLWLGADGQGLYRIRKQIITTLSQEQGLVQRNVYPVYEDHAGTIWVGGWAGGLSQIKAGKITNYTARDGLSAGAVVALGADRAGRLWVATRTDLQTFEQGRFTSVKAQYPLGAPDINAIYQEPTGALWFGTNNGLWRHHNGQTQHFTASNGLPGANVRTMIEAAAGGLWIGCYGGLAHWREGRLTAWTEPDGLPGNTVRSLYEDRDGVLWIGTYDSGLGRFKDGRFTRYTTREGLFNDGVFQILEDDFGYLWMSCNQGIYRVRKQELNEFAAGQRRDITSIAFGKSDGMLNVECNGGLWPAGVKARDGRLWFPTQDGVAVVDPAAVTTNQQPPPVLIEEVRQDRVARDFRDEVRLQPGQGNLEIQYTALCFTNAAQARFKYKLEGLDADWVDAGTRRTAFFSYLPPSSYTFRVIAANSDGVWNTEGKSLRIRVLPPFYRTWWFVTLALLLVVGGVFAVYQYRVTQLERRQAAQQAFTRQLLASQEGERKRLAAELHDSLGQHLVVIKNLALMVLQTPAKGDAQQIADISATASQAIREVKEISYNLRPYQLDRIGLTKAIAALLKKAEAASGIRFIAALDDLQGAFPKEAEINFYRIVQECVNNILKHSQATEAWVTIHHLGQRVRLTIRDNGKGFTPGVAAGEAPGFGLLGIHERAQLLGSQARIHSAPGQGVTTTLEITLPAGDTQHDQ
jgi:signal transduction histidine kinase/ligand-binding sensor domain-containing protein